MAADKVRLLCLPFAGGNSYSYREWQRQCPPSLELVPLELPGRGRRPTEPLLTSTDALTEDLYQRLGGQLRSPYAIFGHSFGACLGYLLTRKLLAAGQPPPLHLFCSGRQAPSVPKDQDRRHLLPRAQFVQVLRQMGGCPEPVLRDPELLDYFEPVIRADFQADAEYRHRLEPPMPLPITVMIGARDLETTTDGARRWQGETTVPITLRIFPGGHFFLFEHSVAVLSLVAQMLAVV